MLLDRHMSGTYAGGAVLAAVLSSPRRTARVAALAVLAALLSGTWNQNLGSPEWTARLAACLALSALAVGISAVAERRRAGLEHTTRLAQRILDALAVELTGARTTKEVAEGFVLHAVRTLGAQSAMVLSLDPDGMLRSVVWDGRGGPQADHYQEFPLASDVPGAVATRTRTDLHLRSRREIERTFPDLAGYYSDERSLHVLPLHRGERTLGALAMTFGRSTFVAGDDAFLRSVAGSLTSALLRAEELQLVDAAAQRTALLAEASLTLSRHLEVDELLHEVGRLLVPRFSDWCAVQLLRDDRLSTVFLQHRDEETTRAGLEMVAAFPTRTDREHGAAAVVRTGRSEHYPYIAADVLDDAAVSEEHLQVLRNLGLTSAIIAPLQGRSTVLGALTLIHAESGRKYSEEDLRFLEQIADRVALALDTASTLSAQSERLADVMLVAEAAQRAILAPPPERVGPVALAARYRSAALEAQVGGDLYEVVATPDRVRLLVGDVRGKGLGAVRTATVVLGEFRAAAAGPGDLSHVAREIDGRLGPHLPDPEDFVTALLVEIRGDGALTAVSCGHPSPVVLSRDGTVRTVHTLNEPPLGLGVDPAPTTDHLDAGDRLLLFTDGLIEARRPDGTFVDLEPLLRHAATAPFSCVLDMLLERLREVTGHELDDDLALLLACYDPAT